MTYTPLLTNRNGSGETLFRCPHCRLSKNGKFGVDYKAKKMICLFPPGCGKSDKMESFSIKKDV